MKSALLKAPSLSYIIVFIWIVLTPSLYSQKWYTQVHTGSFFYQGDLTPDNIPFSFGPGKMSLGISGGRQFNDYFSINVHYFYGSIEGADSYSSQKSKRTRNLSFSSDIHELGITGDFHVNALWKSLNKYKIHLYLTYGWTYFHFNPTTVYKGITVDLQKVGTEGQYLENSPIKPYNLNSYARMLGGKVLVDITKNISLGFELIPRKTYTDYLDDVSREYISYTQLVQSGNILAANLTNRSGELYGTNPIDIPTGTPRGNPNNNDWYTYTGVLFRYTFNSKNSISDTNIPQ